MIRNTPTGASIAEDAGGVRLYAPAAERNRDALAALVAQVAPQTGNALEIASGTGQHVIAFAQACPNLMWQPSDVLEDRLASIDAYAAGSGMGNVSKACFLEATLPGWATSFPDVDFVFLANLLHLISRKEVETLIAEGAIALAPAGTFLIYGPFKRDGQLTSPGDQAFHDSLIAQDPEIGYKDQEDIVACAETYGLSLLATHEMPANNLALEFTKPG